MEGFDNYGLRVKIIADYQYDEGRRAGQFREQLADPGLEEVLESVLCMIEGCWGWGISRLEVIERVKAELDSIAEEYKTPVYRCDKSARERIMAERSNDILDRIREAKRGPLEDYVGHVLDDAYAEIERLKLGLDEVGKEY